MEDKIMLQKEPYFMKKKDWYYHDPEENKYHLTDKAPREAIESYNEFYEENIDIGFYHFLIQDTEKSYREDLKKQGKSNKEIEQEIQAWKKRIDYTE